MFKDAKYFLAYIVPGIGFFSIYLAGWFSFLGIVIAYILIPFIELLSDGTTYNHPESEEPTRLKERFFDFLLYLNIPLHWGILIYFFYTVSTQNLLWYEYLGMTLTMGTLCSALGINVAHELGHRKTKYEQFMSKVLLVTALYLHFFIEHNQGHHKNVSTDLDPASSRKGETVYAFYFRSVFGGFRSAWRIEKTRLLNEGKAVLGVSNRILWYELIQLTYVLTVYFVFGWQAMVVCIAAAIIGFLLLESVNYVEHYGLRRKKLASGRYENTQPWHSWNSNHEVGRILLYELTRHSDHHFKSNRKYQILRHFDEAPQLPFGYPGSVILAWIPPLWFYIMNKRVDYYREKFDMG